MDSAQLIKNLSVPDGIVDAVIDTDAGNEIDDQFALTYLLNSTDKINLKAIYAAPFYSTVYECKSNNPKDGMYKSYDEILKILDYTDNKEYSNVVFHGAGKYMDSESVPVESDASRDLVRRAKEYSPDNPLYVIAIAAITNIASALIMDPEISKNIVVVWLGGHSLNMPKGCAEYNMMNDIAAARVVYKSDVPVVQLPCKGVVTSFYVTEQELKYWLSGKNKICDYLVEIVMKEQSWLSGKPWSRVIWDVTAVGWLLNEGDRFMESQIIPCHIPQYDMEYEKNDGKLIRYVNYIKRDELLEDLIGRITK